jgi:hypothetical protein
MTGPNRGHRDTIPGRGERKLRQALRNLRPGALNRRRPPTHQQPISIEPSNPLEAILIERLRRLDADIQELKTRVNWLILAIVGACLTFIFKTLLG